jgi:hypothetical protein
MFPPEGVYPKNPQFITLEFDREAPNAREALRTFKDSFGDGYGEAETLDIPHHFCPHPYSGDAMENAS